MDDQAREAIRRGIAETRWNDETIAFFQLLVQLRKIGATYRALARFSGISKSTLQREWPAYEAIAEQEYSLRGQLQHAAWDLEFEAEHRQRLIEGTAQPLLLSQMGQDEQPQASESSEIGVAVVPDGTAH